MGFPRARHRQGDRRGAGSTIVSHCSAAAGGATSITPACVSKGPIGEWERSPADQLAQLPSLAASVAFLMAFGICGGDAQMVGALAFAGDFSVCGIRLHSPGCLAFDGRHPHGESEHPHDSQEILHSHDLGSAESAALTARPGDLEADLLAIVEAWPNLPDEAKERIRGIVRRSLGGLS